MAAIGRYDIEGPAEYRRARTAALVDFTAALLLAVLAFPFPFARAALPVPVFVVSILASIVVAHVLYLVVALLLWGRTPGMYLLDIGLEADRISVGAALLWGFGAAVAFWPTVASSALGDPEAGLPVRLSGLVTYSTAMHGPGEDA